jgi:hypothetical protein
MSFAERMGSAGMDPWFGQRSSFWIGLKRFDWTSWMPKRRVWARRLRRGRVWASRLPQRCRHKTVQSPRWRHTGRGLPCWGLGFAAGWPWG